MRSTDTIREELRLNGREQRRLRASLDRLERSLGKLLCEARAHPEMTVSEAADLAGIRRDIAYRFMSRVNSSGRSDDTDS